MAEGEKPKAGSHVVYSTKWLEDAAAAMARGDVEAVRRLMRNPAAVTDEQLRGAVQIVHRIVSTIVFADKHMGDDEVLARVLEVGAKLFGVETSGNRLRLAHDHVQRLVWAYHRGAPIRTKMTPDDIRGWLTLEIQHLARLHPAFGELSADELEAELRRAELDPPGGGQHRAGVPNATARLIVKCKAFDAGARDDESEAKAVKRVTKSVLKATGRPRQP